MAKRLKLRFEVVSPQNHLPGWFSATLARNVTNARFQSSAFDIYDKLLRGETSLNIKGNAGEICRNFYDIFGVLSHRDLSIQNLAQLVFCENDPPQFARSAIASWRASIDIPANKNGFSLLDFMYWEQRMGNWGGMYPSEQDIAVDEISPFNCRELLELLVAAPLKMRTEPKYELYRLLINEMWPEALSFPINPPSLKEYAGLALNKLYHNTPDPVLRLLRKVFK